MNKVLIAPAVLAGRTDGEFVDIFRAAGFEMVFPQVRRQMVEAEILEALSGVDASLAGSEPYTRRVLDAHPQLRVIARVGVGYDAVDVAAATDHNIPVCTTPNTNHDAVAEHTFALLLGAAKNIVQQHFGTMTGKWPRGTNLPVRGQTLGLVGLGRIGKAVALRGKAFLMNVVAYEPYPDEAFVHQHGIKLLPLEEVFRQADFLSLHIPMSTEAKHLINKKTLALMKPTAFLVNTARGGLVNECDLLEALQHKRLGGAALDVFEEEPPCVGPLLELPNVVLTPHAAGGDTKSREDMAASAAQAIVDLSRGVWPAEKVVNPAVRDKFRWK